MFIQGFNALHYAAASGNPYHALIVIFEHASNEVATGQSVITAMHLAAAKGYEEALAVLLSKVSLIFSLSVFFSYHFKSFVLHFSYIKQHLNQTCNHFSADSSVLKLFQVVMKNKAKS